MLDSVQSPLSEKMIDKEMFQQKSSSTAAFTFNTAIHGARPVTAKTHLIGVNSKSSVQSTINHLDNSKKSRMLAKRRF